MASTIEAALIADLKTQTSVTGYVNQKIYYLAKDKDATPNYIVMTNPSHTRDPITQTRQQAGQARLDFHCISRDKWTAKSIAEAVKEVYRNRTGAIQGMSIWNIKINECRPLPGVGEFRYITEMIVDYSE